MTTERKFVCREEDLNRFVKTCESWITDGVYAYGRPKLILDRLIKYLTELESYGLQMDDYSNEFFCKALETMNFVDFHYAIHHMIFQLYEAHIQGRIMLPGDRFEFFSKITSDCIWIRSQHMVCRRYTRWSAILVSKE